MSVYLEASSGGSIREGTNKLQGGTSKKSESRDRNLKASERILLPNEGLVHHKNRH
jgi:hypothetical protein